MLASKKVIKNMEAKKLYNILKGPYEIIGKSGEYYQVDDISDIAIVFGSAFDKFFTLNIEQFISSTHEKLDITNNYAYNDCSYFIKRLASDFLDGNEYSSKEMDAIKSISTDLLTQIYSIKIKDHENQRVQRKHFSESYFLIKHKHYYNELSTIDATILSTLLMKVAKNNKDGFHYYYEKVFLGRSLFFRYSNGSKPSRYRTFQRIKTTSERRWNIAHVNEYGQELVRGRRRHLPNTWDDYVRVYQRNWKQKKVKKQWMKNFKRHQDTMPCSQQGFLFSLTIEKTN